MTDQEIISTLKQKKFKITKVRSGIVTQFTQAKSPIAAKDLLEYFHFQMMYFLLYRLLTPLFRQIQPLLPLPISRFDVIQRQGPDGHSIE